MVVNMSDETTRVEDELDGWRDYADIFNRAAAHHLIWVYHHIYRLGPHGSRRYGLTCRGTYTSVQFQMDSVFRRRLLSPKGPPPGT